VDRIVMLNLLSNNNRKSILGIRLLLLFKMDVFVFVFFHLRYHKKTRFVAVGYFGSGYDLDIQNSL
jgi:hypothetical protein